MKHCNTGLDTLSHPKENVARDYSSMITWVDIVVDDAAQFGASSVSSN